MKCAGCGEEFPNLNALTKHKQVCPAGKKPEEENGSTYDPAERDNKIEIVPDGIKITDGAVYTLEEAINRGLSADAELKCIIPIELCPEEIKYYSLGKTVGLRIEGKYTPEGVEVQEVKLIR